jgi:hypothetical protein
VAAQGLREVSQINILCDELDDGIRCVQEGADAWCLDPKIGRQFAKLSIRYADAAAPDGWFFLNEHIFNRKTIADLIKAGHLEVDQSAFTLSDGGQARLGRLVRR